MPHLPIGRQTMVTESGSSEVLFFMPDLGGFTKFVAETEVAHSAHIIKELLEVLVDSNILGLQVSEFEGDAVLFYRNGPPPSLAQLVAQARAMYVAFHTRLKMFEYACICQCGACSGVGGIALKMVAHFGAATRMQVKNHMKLIGKDVIIAHRLLKNSVGLPEYLLVTQATLSRLPDAALQMESFAVGANAYDDLGTIDYQIRALDGYLQEVKFDPPPPPQLKNPSKLAGFSRRIDAPLERVYQELIDLPGRMRWMPGLSRVEMPEESPNHLGKHHRCVRGEAGTEVVTTEIKVSDAALELWETDLRQVSACRYLITRMPQDRAEITVEFYVRGNPVRRLLFRIFVIKRLLAFFEQSISNLGVLCEGSTGKRPAGSTHGG